VSTIFYISHATFNVAKQRAFVHLFCVFVLRTKFCQAPVAHAYNPEAEIDRIAVQSQPGQIVHETLSQKHSTNKKREWLKM
jgi:hypothetical protein